MCYDRYIVYGKNLKKKIKNIFCYQKNLKTEFLAQNKQISQTFEREKILQFLFQIFTKYLS